MQHHVRRLRIALDRARRELEEVHDTAARCELAITVHRTRQILAELAGATLEAEREMAASLAELEARRPIRATVPA